MPHSRGSRFHSRPQRRAVSWSFGPAGAISSTASSAAVFPLSAQALIDDLTVVRMRGSLTFITSLPSSSAFMTYAFGLCIVSENAAGIGVTAIPQPLDDIGWDGWFYHRQGIAGADGQSSGSAGAATASGFQFDSKAMRKMHLTDVIVACLQVVETGAVTVFSQLDTRMLVKLP